MTISISETRSSKDTEDTYPIITTIEIYLVPFKVDKKILDGILDKMFTMGVFNMQERGRSRGPPIS